jgi:hypothetical protein
MMAISEVIFPWVERFRPTNKPVCSESGVWYFINTKIPELKARLGSMHDKAWVGWTPDNVSDFMRNCADLFTTVFEGEWLGTEHYKAFPEDFKADKAATTCQ